MKWNWVDNNHVTDEHSYAVSSKSTLTNECIYGDDTELTIDCAERKKMLQLVSPTFYKFNIQIIDTKTEHMVLKINDKKNEKWRNRKMLSSLMSDQKDILRRKQFSTTAHRNMNNIWIK